MHDNPASLPPLPLSKDQVHSFNHLFLPLLILLLMLSFNYQVILKYLVNFNVQIPGLGNRKIGNRKSKGSVEGETHICGK